MRYHYHVYGVRLTSDLPFDFASTSATTPTVAHVELIHGSAPDFEAAAGARDGDAAFACQTLPDRSTYIRWSDLYEFRIASDGTEIVCRALAGGTASVLQNFLFGQALSFALVQQQVEPYHAAVVRIGDAAIALIGDCTFGKSTLLASFLQAGYAALTDDLLVVDYAAGRPLAVPGSGRIKLMPDSAAAFLDPADTRVQLLPTSTKRSFRIPHARVERAAVLLDHLFVLPAPDARAQFSSIDIVPLPRAATLRALVQNTFNVELLHRDRLARQFEHAGQLASDVGGFALQYPAGLAHLHRVRDRIVEHVTRERIR